MFYDVAMSSTQWQLFIKAYKLTNAEIHNSSSYLRKMRLNPVMALSSEPLI